jgi:hypothetical protein
MPCKPKAQTQRKAPGLRSSKELRRRNRLWRQEAQRQHRKEWQPKYLEELLNRTLVEELRLKAQDLEQPQGQRKPVTRASTRAATLASQYHQTELQLAKEVAKVQESAKEAIKVVLRAAELVEEATLQALGALEQRC